MNNIKKEDGVSEILGAVLLVSILMTGLTIIAVILLAVPPPGTTDKAVLGIKCAWCPDEKKYDFLIEHEGGENLSLKRLRFILVTGGNTSHQFTPDYVYKPTDPEYYYAPPETCNETIGINARMLWNDTDVLTSGESMKYSYTPVSGTMENITQIVIQEPSTIGYVSITQLRIPYIMNASTYGSIQGPGGAVVEEGAVFVTPSVNKSSLYYAADGCIVEFMYSNYGNTTTYYWGSRGLPWNYIESFNYAAPTYLTPYPPQSLFLNTTALGLQSVMKVKFTGYIEYRLGYRTAAITCDQRVIDYLKK